MDPQDTVTPQEIIAAILIELQRGIIPSHFVNYVRNIYRVYLDRNDYTRLGPLLLAKTKEEAVHALQIEVASLTNPRKSLLKIGSLKNPPKRHEVLGKWLVEILPNDDDDAASNRLMVYSESSTPPAPDNMAGPATVKVPKPAGLDEELLQTERVPGAPARAPANTPVFARLTYDDDAGTVRFDMIQETIKVGRGGGPPIWVDLQLQTAHDISREHFQIRRDATSGKFFIKDLSAFGTSVNGQPVPPSIERVNGKQRDKNIEIELPREATLNLAGKLTMKFKASKK